MNFRSAAVSTTFILALAATTVPVCASAPQAERPSEATTAPIDAVISALITPSGLADPALTSLYVGRPGPLFTTAQGLSPRGERVARVMTEAAAYGLDENTYAFPPVGPSSTPDQQAARELTVAKAVLAYARDARGGRIPDPSRVSSSLDMKPHLPERRAVLDAIAAADDAGAALLAFHPQHAGFKALRVAYGAERAAGVPTERLLRLQVNLERWRWMPADLGAFHVWNNVPEQITRVIKDSDVIHTERIVVGKPGHSTPVMSADMLYVMFHPSWGVPNGIKTNEIGPQLRRASARNETLFDSLGFGGAAPGRASAILARHQLRAFHNGKEVNADQVDWRSADVRQFTFTQPPSNKNVLGVVKFRFPNKYDVYMHDTQDRHLFTHPVRAYSHGCMRVQNPVRFAAVLLGHDKGWSEEKVQAFVPGGRSADITLTTPIPVHLTYFTASVDESGKVQMHGDIYGSDARIASALAGKPVALAAAVKLAAQPTTASRSIRTATGATRVGVPAWSPWPALSAN